MTLEQGYKIVVQFIDENDETVKLDKTMLHAYFTLEEHVYGGGTGGGHNHDDQTVKISRKELDRCHDEDFNADDYERHYFEL